MTVTQNTYFDKIPAFTMSANYTEWNINSPEALLDSHIHPAYEIYINVSGDVSFVTEDRIYPIKPGDVIITKPYAYHHCVYHNEKLHKHFWILVTTDSTGWLDQFFTRITDNNNLLTLSGEHLETMFSLCHEMTRTQAAETHKYLNFFRLLTLLEGAKDASPDPATYHADLIFALDYMNNHFTEKISIHEIAEKAYVSINTLERHFAENIKISPGKYLRKKRFAHAVKLLSEGYSVQQACDKSGFSDCSKFIAEFKTLYGTTPLKYKKNQQGNFQKPDSPQ